VAEVRTPFVVALPLGNRWLGVTPAGAARALGLALKALAAVSCLYFVSLNTPMVAFLGALRRLRLPPFFVEVMGLVYRFIFLLLETTRTISLAQRSRLGYGNLRSSFRCLGTLVSMLFVRSFIRADALYTALLARGYESELKVLEPKYHPLRGAVALAGAVAALLVALRFLFLR
jgi:cobalt/nickel transport system permease protein